MENDTQKVLGGFLDTNRYRISTRPSESQQKIMNLPNSGLCRSGRPQSKNLRNGKKRIKYQDLPRELKTIEHEGYGDTNGLVKCLEDL